MDIVPVRVNLPGQLIASQTRRGAIGSAGHSKAAYMAICAVTRIRLHLAAGVISAILAFHLAHAASPEPDQVSLSEQTITWSTVKYATSAETAFVSGSSTNNTIVESQIQAACSRIAI